MRLDEEVKDGRDNGDRRCVGVDVNAGHVRVSEDDRDAVVAGVSVLIGSDHVLVIFAESLAVIADDDDQGRIGDTSFVEHGHDIAEPVIHEDDRPPSQIAHVFSPSAHLLVHKASKRFYLNYSKIFHYRNRGNDWLEPLARPKNRGLFEKTVVSGYSKGPFPPLYILNANI